MDTYRKTLLLLKDLLHKSGNSIWEQWIDRDIDEWDKEKSTSHHKSAFGGMGSINDLAVGGQEKIGTWKNNMFDLLKSISWTFAAKNKIQFPTTTVSNIEGTVCRDCTYAEVSESGIERYISSKHLPAMIANLLSNEQYIDLTNFQMLTNKPEVIVDRQNLLTALTKAKINISKTGNWLKTCPVCNSTDTCVFRWHISGIDDKVLLTRRESNLSINADRTKTTWWKRLRKKNIFFSLILVVFYTNFSFGQTKMDEYKKMLIGKWNYDVAYDTIAVASDGKNASDNFFFIRMKISKDKIRISNINQNWNGRWEVNINNEFLIYLNNNKTLKYNITKLNNKNLELQNFGVSIPTLGYIRK
jgi:hypothetical protein